MPGELQRGQRPLSDERYRLLVEAISQVVWRTDADGHALALQGWTAITGQSADDARGLGWLDAVHPDDREPIKRTLAEPTQAKTAFVLRHRLRLAEGSHRWFLSRAVPVEDADGKVIEWVGMSVDIDETVRHEEAARFLSLASVALSESLSERATLNALAGLAVEHLADGCMITVVRDDGSWEQVATTSRDPAKAALVVEMERRYPLPADSISGYPRAIRSGEAELVPLGAFDEEILPKLARDAEHLRLLRMLDMYSALVVPLTARGRTRGAITLVLHGPSRRRPFDAADLELGVELGRRAGLALDNARLFDAAARARTSAEAAAARISALQATTAALSTALTPEEVANVVIEEGLRALAARAGSVAFVDETGTRLDLIATAGYPEESVKPFRSIPLESNFPLADAARTGKTVLLQTAEDRDAFYPHLADLRRMNGGGAMAALPLIAGSEVVGAIGFNFDGERQLSDPDIAFLYALARQCVQALERAQLYAAERSARSDAEAASAAKSQFLATMSHETRQPIHATIGWVEMLEMEIRGPLTPQQREDLKRIRVNQQRLLDLINDILSFAKNEASAVPLTMETANARNVIETLAPLLEPQFSAKGVALHIDGREREVLFRGDRERVVQICLNLASNALKATAAGGSVVIDCSAEEGRPTITVTDTGVGIPADKVGVIFEPFTQLGRSLSNPAEGGVGLGLAISRQLARAMGADVTVESELGAGSRFTLTLAKA
jgi:PAS domain S-box-containing protein